MSRSKSILLCSQIATALMLSITAARATETVGFRLPYGKTMHFNDSARAQQHLDAVKKLGCEVSQGQHGNHVDVSYRATHWKSLDLADERLAQQWESWLKAAGFETMRGLDGNSLRTHYANRPGSGLNGAQIRAVGFERVDYRLATWKTQHFEDSAKFEEFVALMKAFGAEVQTKSHRGHKDVRVRCMIPKYVNLPNHEIARTWETWLTQQGFEVQHQH